MNHKSIGAKMPNPILGSREEGSAMNTEPNNAVPNEADKKLASDIWECIGGSINSKQWIMIINLVAAHRIATVKSDWISEESVK